MEELQIYQNHEAVDRYLKQIIIAGVEDMYIAEIKLPLVGYMTINTQDMLDYLLQCYRKITSKEIQENMAKATSQCSMSSSQSVLPMM
eukprot:4313404-Ditylum_brightwellii.AAC.1